MELNSYYLMMYWVLQLAGVLFLVQRLYLRHQFPKNVFPDEVILRHKGTELGELMRRVNYSAQELQISLQKEFGELVIRDLHILRVMCIWKLIRNRISRDYNVGRDPKTVAQFQSLISYIEMPIHGFHDPKFRQMMLRVVTWDHAGKYWSKNWAGSQDDDVDLSRYQPQRIPSHQKILRTLFPPSYPKEVAQTAIVEQFSAPKKKIATKKRRRPPTRDAVVRIIEVEKSWSGLGKFFQSEIDDIEGEIVRDGGAFRLRCPNSHLAILLFAIGIPKPSAIRIMTMFLDQNGSLIEQTTADQAYRKVKSRKYTKVDRLSDFLNGSAGRMWKRWAKFKARLDEATYSAISEEYSGLAERRHERLLVRMNPVQSNSNVNRS